MTLEETVTLYQEGKGVKVIARLAGLSTGAIRKRLHSAGVIMRPPQQRHPVNDEDIRRLYLEGFGALWISRRLGCSETTVLKRVTAMGIVDPTRQFTRKHDTPASRNAKRRPHLFRVATKRNRFAEEHGVCQWCQQPIAPRWDHPDVTYHHITPIDSGGTNTDTNCMVLHRRCHEDPRIFRALHEGRRWQFQTAALPLPTTSPRRKVQRCGECGAKKPNPTTPCRRCAHRAALIQVKPLLEEGRLNYFEIAKVLNVTHRTICNYARRLGLRALADKSIMED